MIKFRNLISSFHLAAVLLVALGISVFGYLIARHYHVRLDLSEEKIYSLSAQTTGLLERLRGENIHLYGFFKLESPSRPVLENLLEEYVVHHPQLKVEIYDPDQAVAKTKEYQIDNYDTVVVEIKGRRGKTRQVSEEALTNLIASVSSPKANRIVFAAGYGGPALAEGKEKFGYGILREKLSNSNYEVKEIALLRDGLAKGDDLLVLGGPRVDMLPEELKVIRDFLNRGGNLLVLADPVNEGEGAALEQFLLEYGIMLGDNVIVDKLSKLFGADFLIPLITDYRPHPITQGFRLACFFSIARSVAKAQNVPDGIDVTELAFTGAGSWAETDLKNLSDGKTELSEKDVRGPVSVAVAASLKGKGRILVIGDSDFATNSFLNLSGNKDFLLNSMAWLVGDENAISIRPKIRKVTPLYLKETDQQYLFYVPVLGLPLIFLASGAVVFFRRRRFH